MVWAEAVSEKLKARISNMRGVMMFKKETFLDCRHIS
jgi:hypothetical protein